MTADCPVQVTPLQLQGWDDDSHPVLTFQPLGLYIVAVYNSTSAGRSCKLQPRYWLVALEMHVVLHTVPLAGNTAATAGGRVPDN